jgi:hypothetical protein
MITRPKRALAWLPVLFAPIVAFTGSGLGCELLVDVDPMLVDGSPDDVVIPMSLDGYACQICRDVSAEADFDGDEFPPPSPAKDAAAEGSPGDAAGAESAAKDSGAHDAAGDGG